MKITTQNAKELDQKALPPLLWVVEGLVHQGLGMISADPKAGKSMMMMELGICITEGIPFLEHPTHKGDVLYMALEDGERRLQDRVRKISTALGVAPNERLRMRTEASILGAGLEAEIDNHMADFPETTIVIIDVFQRIRPDRNNGNKYFYGMDTTEMAALKAIADKHNICVLLVHHNKQEKNPENPFESILGGQGIFGGVDFAMVLQRHSRGNSEDRMATLYYTSRETEETSFVVEFDSEDCIWKYRGSREELERHQRVMAYSQDPVVRTILHRLAQEPSGFETKPSDFMADVMNVTGEVLTYNEVGKRFKKFSALLLERDHVRCDHPTSTKDRTYRFSRLVPPTSTPVDVDDEDAEQITLNDFSGEAIFSENPNVDENTGVADTLDT